MTPDAPPAPTADALGGTCILVLGAHRSGTSMLAECLGGLGVALGDPDMGPDEQNPRGYFEHYRVVGVNNAVLDRVGARWDTVTFDPTQHDLAGEGFADLRAEALHVLAEIFAGQALWAIKDPRINMLLPFWHAVLTDAGVRVRHVVVVRDPLEVAASELSRIPHLPAHHTMLRTEPAMHMLWAATFRCLLTTVSGDETVVLGHADLLAHPEAVLREVAQLLGLDPARASHAGSAVDTTLHRSKRPEADAGQPWHALTSRLYADLLAVRPLLSDERARGLWDEQVDLRAAFDLIAPLAPTMSFLRLVPPEMDDADRLKPLLIDSLMTAARAARRETAPLVIERIEQALEIYPTHAVLWASLGQARQNAGDQDGAVAALERGLELAPANGHIQWLLGQVQGKR